MNIKIYILNLKRSPHRKQHMQDQLKGCFVQHTFVNAIDGKNKDLEELKGYDSPLRIKAFGRDMQSTEVATTLSHLKAIKQAYNDGVEWAVILEDDCIVLPTFSNALDTLFAVSESVEVVRLYNREKSANFKDVLEAEDFIIKRFNYTNWGGALGYALNRNAMVKYLNNAYPIMHKADKLINGTPQLDVKIYQLSPRVITVTADIASDIGYSWGNHSYSGFKNNVVRTSSRLKEHMVRLWYVLTHLKEYM